MAETPNLRFKGFTDAWEPRKFSEIAQRLSETMVSDDNHPCVEYEDVIAEQGVLNKNIYAKNVHKNGIKFSPETILYGKLRPYLHNWLNPDFNGVATGDWWVLKPINTDKNFLYRLIQTSHYDDAANQTFGTKMPRADWKLISSLEFPIPALIEEQAKIAAVFDNLDHMITLHQRKCDETKELKKFMLQKMFPQKGKKIPEIRFAGFTENWERHKFGELYKISSGYAFKMNDYCNRGVPIINGESIQHGKIESNHFHYLPEHYLHEYKDFVLYEGDIVLGLNRPVTNGNLKIAEIPAVYNKSLLYQRAGKVNDLCDIDKNFTYVLLSKEILKHTLKEAVGSDQPFISTSKLDKWEMQIPQKEEERIQIGAYFRNLDCLFTLHQRKCDELKEMKKFMLQNMFPQKG